jgi:pilus assembly protein Flp/PilA
LGAGSPGAAVRGGFCAWFRTTALGASLLDENGRSEEVLGKRSHIFAAIPEEDGQALVEYSLILLLIALVTIAALTSIGNTVSGIINAVAAAL